MTEIRTGKPADDPEVVADPGTVEPTQPTVERPEDGQSLPLPESEAPAGHAEATPSVGQPQAPATRSLGELVRPHFSRAQVLTAGLCALLGFAAMVQVRVPDDEMLQRARRTDLVQILDGLTQRSDKLEQEITELEATRRDLLSSADRQQTALEQSTERARTLAQLAGTVPATGPGIVLTIQDPPIENSSALLLSAVQELRDAGAEALQVEGAGDAAVRVVASTYFLDLPDGVVIDGVRLEPPYRILAIGDPAMDRALGIPGGVIEEVASVGGRAKVEKADEVVIDALHAISEPKYARSVGPGSSD